MNETITKIKVERTFVRNFPFDVFYLVPVARRDVLPRLFPWSLCFPPTRPLVLRMQDLRLHGVEALPHQRRREEKDVGKPLLKEYGIDLDQHFVVVPVLPLMTTERAQKERVKLPGYLLASKHKQKATKESKSNDESVKQTSAFPEIFTDSVVLFTPDGPLRPVCKGCPRHLLHMQGKCTLGCQYCYEELILKRSAYEQLQDDNAVGDSDSGSSPQP